MRSRLFLNFNKLYFYAWFFSVPNYKQQQLSFQLRRNSVETPQEFLLKTELKTQPSFSKNVDSSSDFLFLSSGIRPFGTKLAAAARLNDFFSIDTEPKCKAALTVEAVHYDRGAQVGVTPMVGPRKMYRGLDARIAAIRDRRWYSYLRSNVGFITATVPTQSCYQPAAATLSSIKYSNRGLVVDLNNASKFINRWSEFYRSKLAANSALAACTTTHQSIITAHNFEEGESAAVLQKRGTHALTQNSWQSPDVNFVSGRVRVRKHIITDSSTNLLLANVAQLFFVASSFHTSLFPADTLTKSLKMLTEQDYKNLDNNNESESVILAFDDQSFSQQTCLQTAAAMHVASSYRRSTTAGLLNPVFSQTYKPNFWPNNVDIEHDGLSYQWFQSLVNSAVYSNLAILGGLQPLQLAAAQGAKLFANCIYLFGLYELRGVVLRQNVKQLCQTHKVKQIKSQTLFFDVTDDTTTNSWPIVHSDNCAALPQRLFNLSNNELKSYMFITSFLTMLYI